MVFWWCAMQSCGYIPKFWRSILSPFSGLRWRHSLHDAATSHLITVCGKKFCRESSTWERKIQSALLVIDFCHTYCPHLNLFLCNNSFLDQSFRIFVQNRWCVLYLTVHQGLSEHRFINFIVAIASVAHLEIK